MTITNKIETIEFNPDEWVEIKAGEYRLLKVGDPKNVNGYTCRLRFKYYKKKDADKKYFILNKRGEIIPGITIDITAKEDIKNLMRWDEEKWNLSTIGESKLNREVQAITNKDIGKADEEYLDKEFPKGETKFRGQAMVLLTLARIEGRKEAIKILNKLEYAADENPYAVMNRLILKLKGETV